MPSPENVRIAVLIDADNTSHRHAEALLEEVAKYGVPTVKRAYGDWTDTHLSGWLSDLAKHGIQPMLQIANTKGKNSTDSALIIDAMDLLYSGNVDAFALVSSDSDFTSLAIRLRGSGRTVYGMGLRKTPEALRQAVDRFIYLEDLQEGGSEEGEESEQRRIPDLRRLLERAVHGTAHDDGWASLSSMANHITRVEPSFSVKDYGASKLVDLVRAQSYLDVDQPDSGSVHVRLRSHRSAGKTAISRSSNAKGSAEKTSAGRTAAGKAAAEETAAEQPAAQVPAGETASEAPAKKAAAKRTPAKRTRKTAAAKKAAAAPQTTEPATAPAIEPALPVESSLTTATGPEPVTKHTVTTRKRSARKAQSG